MSALRKILVVDDDPVVGTSFDRVLSPKGYTVIAAHDAAEALERLRQDEVDLVYTDIKMPGMDGLDLAERVKARRPWTPVVIVTGYGTRAHEERAKAAGVTAFLHKPLSPEMIEGSAVAALQSAAAPAAAPTVAPEHAAEPAAETAPRTVGEQLKNIALFVAAPFIGLVYAVFLPFVGLGMLAWFAGRALAGKAWAHKVYEGAKFGLTLLAAPLIGLAYILVGPFVGLAALAWIAGRAVVERRRS